MGPDGYFDREYFEFHPGKRRYLTRLLALLGHAGVEAGTVLDVGAGYGFFLEALVSAGYQAVGLELSLHAARVASRQSGVPVVAQSAEEPFPFRAGAFDAVTLFDVIEHLADHTRCLAECRKALRPGGCLLVITLNAGSLARPLLGRQWSWYKDPTHKHLFSARSLAAACRAAGFERVAVRCFFNFCSVGESTPFLKPLRAVGRLVFVPRVGDALLAVARRSG